MLYKMDVGPHSVGNDQFSEIFYIKTEAEPDIEKFLFIGENNASITFQIHFKNPHKESYMLKVIPDLIHKSSQYHLKNSLIYVRDGLLEAKNCSQIEIQCWLHYVVDLLKIHHTDHRKLSKFIEKEYTGDLAKCQIKYGGMFQSGRKPMVEGKALVEEKSHDLIQSKEKNSKEIPDGFLCPISLEVMKEPVILPDGTTYERNNILKWFEKNNTSPKTMLIVEKVLIPNLALRSVIEEFQEKHPEIFIDIPDGFLCPVSLEVMKEPIILPDGTTYERKNILKWFEENNTSPKTMLVVEKVLIPNLALRSVIEEFQEKHPEMFIEQQGNIGIHPR